MSAGDPGGERRPVPRTHRSMSPPVRAGLATVAIARRKGARAGVAVRRIGLAAVALAVLASGAAACGSGSPRAGGSGVPSVPATGPGSASVPAPGLGPAPLGSAAPGTLGTLGSSAAPTAVPPRVAAPATRNPDGSVPWVDEPATDADFAAPAGTPANPLARLDATIRATPRRVNAGVTVRFQVVLRNPGRTAVPLTGRPGYEIELLCAAAPGRAAFELSTAYLLNNRPVHAVPAGGAVVFDMRAAIPGLRPLPGPVLDLTWRMLAAGLRESPVAAVSIRTGV